MSLQTWTDVYPVDLTVHQAKAVLRKGRRYRKRYRREVWRHATKGYLDWPEVKIWYRGQWWKLALTDLKDDVCVGIGVPEPDALQSDPLRWFREQVNYGARLKNNTFAVVRAFSDG